MTPEGLPKRETTSTRGAVVLTQRISVHGVVGGKQ
jgi:hypothetical protein